MVDGTNHPVTPFRHDLVDERSQYPLPRGVEIRDHLLVHAISLLYKTAVIILETTTSPSTAIHWPKTPGLSFCFEYGKIRTHYANLVQDAGYSIYYHMFLGINGVFYAIGS